MSMGAKSALQRLKRDDNALTALECGLIVALIAVVIVAAVGFLGTSVSKSFSTVGSAVGGADMAVSVERPGSAGGSTKLAFSHGLTVEMAEGGHQAPLRARESEVRRGCRDWLRRDRGPIQLTEAQSLGHPAR